MRGLARRPFTAPATLLLLLCVAAYVLWVRSVEVEDRVTYREPGDPSRYVLTTWVVRSGAGSVCFERLTTRLAAMPMNSPGALERLDAAMRALGERRGAWGYHRDDAPVPPEHRLASPPATGWCKLGGGFIRQRTPAQDSDVLAVPYWLVALATGLLPARRVSHAIRRGRRRLVGRCPDCGYDLRATPGRCPECGAPSAPPPPPA